MSDEVRAVEYGNGPDFPDGCDDEGFPGGCQRMHPGKSHAEFVEECNLTRKIEAGPSPPNSVRASESEAWKNSGHTGAAVVQPDCASAVRYVWCLTDAHINDLQSASIERVISRLKRASWADIQLRLRINGTFEVIEGEQADWLRHLKRVTEPGDHAQLMAFYQAKDKDELIVRLHHHIEKLQAKLPPDGQPARQQVREG